MGQIPSLKTVLEVWRISDKNNFTSPNSWSMWFNFSDVHGNIRKMAVTVCSKITFNTISINCKRQQLVGLMTIYHHMGLLKREFSAKGATKLEHFRDPLHRWLSSSQNQNFWVTSSENTKTSWPIRHIFGRQFFKFSPTCKLKIANVKNILAT